MESPDFAAMEIFLVSWESSPDATPITKAFATFARGLFALHSKYKDPVFLKNEAKFGSAFGQALATLDAHMRREGGVDVPVIAEGMQLFVNMGKAIDANIGSNGMPSFIEGWNSVAITEGIEKLE